MSWMNVPGEEVQPAFLGNFGAPETMRGVFAACGASFGSNSRGEYHHIQTGLLFGLKTPPVT